MWAAEHREPYRLRGPFWTPITPQAGSLFPRRITVKAEAAEGGGAPAPALTRPSRPQNHPMVRSGLTDKTVAPLFRGKPNLRRLRLSAASAPRRA
jgi:hypothetical protein